MNETEYFHTERGTVHCDKYRELMNETEYFLHKRDSVHCDKYRKHE